MMHPNDLRRIVDRMEDLSPVVGTSGGDCVELTVCPEGKPTEKQLDTVADFVYVLLSELPAIIGVLEKWQDCEFHPDWSLLKATRESLRESWDTIRDLQKKVAAKEAEAVEALKANVEASERDGGRLDEIEQMKNERDTALMVIRMHDDTHAGKCDELSDKLKKEGE